MSYHKVAVVCSSNTGSMNVLDHKPEQVLLPLVDECPEVALVELFCSVE